MLPILSNDKESFLFFNVTILEHLWLFRNRIVHNESAGSIELSMLKIWNRSKEYEENLVSGECKRLNKSFEMNGDNLQLWRRPCSGVIKINSDAAMTKKVVFWLS